MVSYNFWDIGKRQSFPNNNVSFNESSEFHVRKCVKVESFSKKEENFRFVHIYRLNVIFQAWAGSYINSPMWAGHSEASGKVFND